VPVAPADALARIRSAPDTRAYVPFDLRTDFGLHGFTARTWDSSFWIRARSPSGNAFAPYLYGRVEPTPGGAIVHARFQMRREVRIIYTATIGVFVLVALVGLLQPDGHRDVGGLLAFLGLIVLFLAVVLAPSRWLTGDERKLRSLLAEIFPEGVAAASDSAGTPSTPPR
jgi:hypothetical protein